MRAHKQILCLTDRLSLLTFCKFLSDKKPAMEAQTTTKRSQTYGLPKLESRKLVVAARNLVGASILSSKGHE